MIQIIGLRDYTLADGSTKKKEAFFDEKWRARSVAELFENIDKLIEKIPEAERYNLYYTSAYCDEESSRMMIHQDVIPFDIDGIDHSRIGDYIAAVVDVLGIPMEDMGIVATGNGLQFLIGLEEPFDDKAYFDINRVQYKGVCKLIRNNLESRGIKTDDTTVDTSVFSHARLLRLPNTKNIKPVKGEKNATLINSNINPVDFDLAAICGIPRVNVAEQINPAMLDRLPPPDTDGVINGCDYLKYCYDNQESISEPQWYAMLSIIGRLENGKELAHDYSRHHPDYSPSDTTAKLEQSLASAGPRTCDSISMLWEGCEACPNWGKCKSPITIKSEDYIKTKDTGFYYIEIGKDGVPKKGKPDYEGLMKFMYQKTPFITLPEGSMNMQYTGRHWVDLTPRMIDYFAEQNFEPSPTNSMCNEFKGKVLRNELVTPDFFNVDGMINFNNGVLNLDDLSIVEHSMKVGFKYCLPFDYDPTATCHRFDQFLKEVTLDDSELAKVLLEFMGYALSGMDASIGQKALILTGDGSNGKSVFMDVLKYLAGKENYATLSMGSEINKLENRYQLDGKLFNVSEETPNNSMMDSTVFKALVAGGEVQARKLYCDAYSLKNNAKLIMACNELPDTKDMSHGMFRRLLIAPFNARFSPKTAGYDPMIREKLFAEASGIMNRCLQHLLEFRDKKQFSDSIAMDKQLQDYADTNSDIVRFIDDAVEPTNGKYVPTLELYQQYKLDCELQGERPRNYRNFCKRLRAIYTEECFDRINHQGKKHLCILNVRFKNGGRNEF